MPKDERFDEELEEKDEEDEEEAGDEESVILLRCVMWRDVVLGCARLRIQ